MDCSIIIVNYNTKSLTLACIESILSQSIGMDYEIIVVDNFSTDGSQNEIRRVYPEVLLIESKTNLGFGRANNLGAEKANGRFLFFLNSDTILLNNAIKLFLEYFEGRPQMFLGCIGCNLLGSDSKINGNGGRFPSIKHYLLDRINALKARVNIDKSTSNFSKKVDYVLGADMFIPKIIFEEVKGFDEQFFMYFEESDLQLRISKLNYKIEIINGPRILHLEGKSSLNSLKKIMMVQSSAFKYYAKNRPVWEYFMLRLIGVIDSLTFLIRRKHSFNDCMKYLKFNISPKTNENSTYRK